jgi:hypothetical protein
MNNVGAASHVRGSALSFGRNSENGDLIMPRVSKLFASQFLRADDLNGAVRTVTIGSCHEETFYGETVHVLDLVGEDSGLRLSEKLAREIKAVLDEDEIDKWNGRSIAIYATQITIRDRSTNEEKLVSTIRAKAAPEVKGLSDDIPF